MSQEQVLCPACERAIEREDERFCSWCRFPVMKIAGKYRLQRKLGEGGVGEVYLAEHAGLRRDELRVLKFIKQEFLETESVQKRFRREMEVTSLLSRRNQHIVQIYDDFGEVPGFGFFYVMEFVRGETLRSVLVDRKRLPGERALHIFRQLCEALTVVHEEGVIHRDLKPENLLLTERSGDKDFLKVIDFGLTKSLNSNTQTALTQGGVGTPAYMSPEQCTNMPTDARTDIYAMGILLYELLTGRLPFDLDTQASGSMAAFAAHIMQPPIPMRVRAPHLRISEAMDQVVLRALSKSPAGRYGSVKQFWTLLAEFGGDMRKEVDITSHEAWHETEPPPLVIATPSHRNIPLPSGDLDAYQSDALPTQVAPSGIEEHLTLPVDHSSQEVAPPKARRKSSLVPLLGGFGLACLLFGGLFVWWTMRGEPLTPPNTRAWRSAQQKSAKLTGHMARPTPQSPDASGATKAPEPQPTRPDTEAKPEAKARKAPQRRVIRRRKSTKRQPRQRPRRRHKRRKPKAPRRRRARPRRKRFRSNPKVVAFERSAAYHKAQRAIGTYIKTGGDRHIYPAMQAHVLLMRGYEKAGARVAKRRTTYEHVVAHFGITKRALQTTHTRIFRRDVTHAQYKLAWLAFQRLRQVKVPLTPFADHKAAISRLRRLAEITITKADEMRHYKATTPLRICGPVLEVDVHLLLHSEYDRALRTKQRQWPRLRGFAWKINLRRWRRSALKEAERRVRAANRIRRFYKLVPNYPCGKHALQQARHIARLYQGRRRY